MCTLMAAPSQTVSMFQNRMHGMTVESKRIEQLISDLNSDKFTLREQAVRNLGAVGRLAEAQLRLAQSGQISEEQRKRIEQMLDQIDRRVLAPELRRMVRAIEVLEYIASAPALEVLRKLAGGDSASEVTEVAKSAMERLARRK